jgi:ribosome-binding protein aMBF1 (putative translation factor)
MTVNVHHIRDLKELVGAARRKVLLKETVRPAASERELLADLGRRIARLREAKGWPRAELARRLGVTRERLGTWERGIRTPPLQALIGLGRELGVSIDELVSGERPSREKKDQAISHLAAAIKLLR